MQYQVPELDHNIYKPIGHCIYCGSVENLSDEHIVPYGLGGNLILPKASCSICAKITSRFELVVQRGSLRPARIYREIQSRKKHKSAPKTYPLLVERNSDMETLEVPLDEYPILVIFPIFSVPGYLKKDKNTKGIHLDGSASVLFGTHPKDAMKKYGATRLVIEPAGDKPTDFARMIAKIAFSMAVATGAFVDVDYSKSFVLPAILGESDDIGHWVGTITEPICSRKGHLHRVLIHRDEEKGLLICDVQILRDTESPRYGAALRPLNENI